MARSDKAAPVPLPLRPVALSTVCEPSPSLFTSTMAAHQMLKLNNGRCISLSTTSLLSAPLIRPSFEAGVRTGDDSPQSHVGNRLFLPVSVTTLSFMHAIRQQPVLSMPGAFGINKMADQPLLGPRDCLLTTGQPMTLQLISAWVFLSEFIVSLACEYIRVYLHPTSPGYISGLIVKHLPCA